MSDNNNHPEQQQAAAPAPGELLEVECAQCKEKFHVRMPLLELVNRPICSMLVIPHPEAQFCPNCGQAYQYFLKGVGMVSSQWTMVNDKTTPRIITVPPGTKLKPVM